MNTEKLIQLSIGGKAYYLNPGHLVAILPISPTSPEVRLYLTRDALDSLPKENPKDTWVTLYDDSATAVLKRFGLQLPH
jgi:hypothetical protein